MSFVSPDPDDGDENPFEQYEEIFREKIREVEDIGRKLGLYMRDGGLTLAPDMEAGEMRPVMVANFAVGEQAWSARVQNPEEDKSESDWRRMATQTEGEMFEDMRADLERRLKDGGSIFDEQEDDDDDGP